MVKRVIIFGVHLLMLSLLSNGHEVTGLVMALIGSFLSILVAIVMPALCFLKIVGQKASRTQIVSSSIIAVLGIICAILGSYSSVSQIMKS